MPCKQVYTLRLGLAKVLGAGGAVSHLIPASGCCVGTLLSVPATQGAVQVRITLGEGPCHSPMPALTSRPVDEARLPRTAFLLLPALSPRLATGPACHASSRLTLTSPSIGALPLPSASLFLPPPCVLLGCIPSFPAAL